MEHNHGIEKAKESPSSEKRPEQESVVEKEPSREAPVVVESTEKPSEPVAPIASVQPEASAPKMPAKDDYHVRLERLLEDNLVDIYVAMPQAARLKFKAAGEEAASQLRQMMEAPKLVFKAVHDLIVKWLKLIPHVNRFFLEQEAKIKTDQVLKLATERRKEKEEGEL